MRRASEKGQILVMVAAGMIVLLAIGAIVVDLGFSWMLRRHEQNAADPASVAAARWLRDASGNARSPFPDAYQEACFYAKQNGFFAGDDASCSTARAAGELEVNWPPVSGPYSGHHGAVQVVITTTHPTFFGRILGQDVATVSTSAVAKNDAGNANSSSLVALQPECSGGSAGNVNGGGEVYIHPADGVTEPGGYVQVNSPCGNSTDDICQNGSGQSALSISGTLRAPWVNVQGSCTYNGTSNFPPAGIQCTDTSPCLDEDALVLGDPLAGTPRPRLSDFPAGVCPDGTVLSPSSTQGCRLRGTGPTACPTDAVTGDPTCTLNPGVYYGGFDVGTGVTLRLRAGLYILAGGGISEGGNSASIEAFEGLTTPEARITIFSTDGPGCALGIAAQCQRAIKVTASGSFTAKATNTASCLGTNPSICPWRGILMWQDGEGSNPTAPIELGGQAQLELAGTIYAPKANVKIAGGSDTSGCSTSSGTCLSIQIISYTWTITGGGLLDMPYDPKELYQLSQRGLVY